MEKKISQLTAKGANLASTDLLEISEVTADGYVSKHVTGSVIAIPSPCFLIWGAQVPNGDTMIMYNSNVIKYA